MFIATLTEVCASVEGMEITIPNNNCRLGLASSISTGHLIFKDQTCNEVLKNNHCLIYERKKASE